MLIGGIVIGAVGALLLLLGKKQKNVHSKMAQQKAVPVKEVVAGQQVEVEGTVVSDQPLKTPFSQQECVYYEYELEQLTQKRDKDGNMRQSWERVGSDKQSTAFRVQDSSGQVTVNPEGADWDVQSLGEKYVQRGDIMQNSILKSVINAVSNKQTRAKESALLVNGPVYVYGQANEGKGGVAIEKGQGKFFISHKSEEQVEKSMAHTAGFMKVLGYIGIIGGVAIIVYSFFG
ncbi:MAG: GIDE domain-containing protein [Patescibacteria group bacterium]